MLDPEILCECEKYATFIKVLEMGENVAYGFSNVWLWTIILRYVKLGMLGYFQ